MILAARSPAAAEPAKSQFERPNGGRPNPPPQLTIRGRWLEPLGFTSGQKVEVITEPWQLVIRLATEG
ncbi:SymE family type I addiction module toxin [Yersinia frederiksenii]|uniref:SymE family type I addiction module toxin n=1 Tax=Yersinia frederiksenii TaxID=29484 RepID=UPI0006821DF1|nr:SymE family type I addiction module toxin [Yersinia frederiksenii]